MRPGGAGAERIGSAAGRTAGGEGAHEVDIQPPDQHRPDEPNKPDGLVSREIASTQGIRRTFLDGILLEGRRPDSVVAYARQDRSWRVIWPTEAR